MFGFIRSSLRGGRAEPAPGLLSFRTGGAPRIAVATALLEVARDRRGASLVEFALVLPVFAALLVGVAQYGLLAFKSIDMRFQANQFARALAAQSVTTSAAQAACGSTTGSVGFTCVISEDSQSYTVTISYAPPTFLKLLPVPPVLSYSAYQFKYAVQ